jgi:hypothetical protein
MSSGVIFGVEIKRRVRDTKTYNEAVLYRLVKEYGGSKRM